MKNDSFLDSLQRDGVVFSITKEERLNSLDPVP